MYIRLKPFVFDPEKRERNRLKEIVMRGDATEDSIDNCKNEILRLNILDILIDNESLIYYDTSNIFISLSNYMEKKEFEKLLKLLNEGDGEFDIIEECQVRDCIYFDCSTYEGIRNWKTDITTMFFKSESIPTPIEMIERKTLIGKEYPPDQVMSALRVIDEYHYFDTCNEYFSELNMISSSYIDKVMSSFISLYNKSSSYLDGVIFCSFLANINKSADVVYGFFKKEVKIKYEGVIENMIEILENIFEHGIGNEYEVSNRAVLEAIRIIRND